MWKMIEIVVEPEGTSWCSSTVSSNSHMVEPVIEEVVNVRRSALFVDHVGSQKAVGFEVGGFLVSFIFRVLCGACKQPVAGDARCG